MTELQILYKDLAKFRQFAKAMLARLERARGDRDKEKFTALYSKAQHEVRVTERKIAELKK